MSFSKFTASFVAILVVVVIVCQSTSATDSHATPAVNGTSNGTLVNKPAGVVAAAAYNIHQNASADPGREGRGVGGAVAGGLAGGAALSLTSGFLSSHGIG